MPVLALQLPQDSSPQAVPAVRVVERAKAVQGLPGTGLSTEVEVVSVGFTVLADPGV